MPWRKPCDRVPYESSAAAKTALAHLRSRRKGKRAHRRKAERSTYPCRRCGKWHITSMSK